MEMAIVTFGLDLAKSVFDVHGMDDDSEPALVCPEGPRGKLLEWVAKLPPCLMGMEACSGRPPRGPRIHEVRTHGAPDGPPIFRPLPDERQTRQE